MSKQCLKSIALLLWKLGNAVFYCLLPWPPVSQAFIPWGTIVFLLVLGVSGNWIEIAYGTSSGAVRVIVQHPETVGSGPQLFQTFTVHRSPVTKIMLSEKHLVSGNVCTDVCWCCSPPSEQCSICMICSITCIVPTCNRNELDRSGGRGRARFARILFLKVSILKSL